jgi:hypothetical protein
MNLRGHGVDGGLASTALMIDVRILELSEGSGDDEL